MVPCTAVETRADTRVVRTALTLVLALLICHVKTAIIDTCKIAQLSSRRGTHYLLPWDPIG